MLLQEAELISQARRYLSKVSAQRIFLKMEQLNKGAITSKIAAEEKMLWGCVVLREDNQGLRMGSEGLGVSTTQKKLDEIAYLVIHSFSESLLSTWVQVLWQTSEIESCIESCHWDPDAKVHTF